MSANWVENVTGEGEVYFYDTVSGTSSWDKPEALLTDEEKRLQSLEFVWAKHAEDVWVPAVVLKKGAGTSTTIKSQTKNSTFNAAIKPSIHRTIR